MRVPISWLKDYVDINEPPAKVAERLTFAGVEVEGIETVGSNYEGFIVGEVRSVEKHPDADKLSVCRVFNGSEELQVVCGASNVKAGGKYPFAPIGTSLPDGSLTIKKAKLRGVESFGMLCSEVELGVSEESAGLMTLDPSWPAGTPLVDVLGPPDTVLELEITPNRPDCLSIIGIARELAAIYRTSVKWPEVKSEARDQKSEVSVDVEDSDGCPRYTARLLKNVKIGPGPSWMQQRLKLAGIRSINNVVDITNYVMLECGQPLHAFDHALLDEGRIVVRRARAGEKIATLDGVVRELNPSVLVIADAKKSVALAGVMGGAGSEIREATRLVLLESACFKSTDIRATSRKLGLSTESSYRFERGVDIGRVEWASRRAAALMATHAEAVIAPGVVDVYPKPREVRKILCRFDRVRSVLGVDAANARIAETFSALGLGVEKSTDEACTVSVPTFRDDLEHEIDLVEEFARIDGLDKIPTPLPRAQVDPGADDRPTKAVQVLRDHLVGLGLREVVNYSMISPALWALFDSPGAAQVVALPNPISADQSMLRPSLIPQMVETLGRNRAHQIGQAALFEIGRVFFRGSDGQTREEQRVVIGLMGPVGRHAMDSRRPVESEEMFLWVKGIWEQLARVQHVERSSLRNTDHSIFEPDQSVALLIDGERAGWLGIAKASARREWRLFEPVAVAEIAVEALNRNVFQALSFTALAAYPCVVRDIALIVDEDIRHEQIEAMIRKSAPKELERVQLFDIFRGESVGKGRKSLAFSLTYRNSTRTLTDEEVNGYHNDVTKTLKAELNVEVREG